MKFSINTIRTLNREGGCDVEPAPEGVDKLVERIGAQLGAVEEVASIGAKYDKAVIVRVASCYQHPNADRLQVCMIDDGGVTRDVSRLDAGLVQVVCGAPNVTAGMTVVWLPPGATVPNTAGTDPFVLEARELRGVVSNGMLASPKELAIGDNHEGILEITEEVAPGSLFAEYYGLKDDVVIDIENKMFTHRPDCFGWLGLAREIAGIQGQAYKSPDWYHADAQVADAATHDLHVEVRNELPELIPRFVIVPIKDVTVGPSPLWLQTRLSRVGLRPINNIVDLTNYYMLLTGQPLHAYDYDKVMAQDPGAQHATISVRFPRDGEKLTLISGKEIEPRSEAILIASASKPIGLAGVMGGNDTEVDDTTRNIILECASFDMYSIRRTSMAHGIFSDAVTRFNKGQSPLQNMAVMAKIVEDIRAIAGGQVAGQVVDNNNLPEDVMQRQALYPDVIVYTDFINCRLGLELSADTICQLLASVEFRVETSEYEEAGEGDNGRSRPRILTVRAPFWRTDIEVPEDVVEEVGRLYGFDKLPLQLPQRDLTPARRNAGLNRNSFLRSLLQQAGANELLTYSFVPKKLLENTGQDPAVAYQLSNALSPELQCYRLSLTPSLLEKVRPNIKAGYDVFALYEIGKVHIKDHLDEAGLPQEFSRLGLVFAANDKAASVYGGAPYYQARLYLDRLLSRFDLRGSSAIYQPLSDYHISDNMVLLQLSAPYYPGRSAVVAVDGRPVGIVGEYKPAVRKNMKLPAFAAGFEIDISHLNPKTSSHYTTIPKFPKIQQDICLRVADNVPYITVYEALSHQLKVIEPDQTLTSLHSLDIYQREDDKEHKQITFRYSIASYERTLTDSEVARLLQEAAGRVAQELHAEIV